MENHQIAEIGKIVAQFTLRFSIRVQTSIIQLIAWAIHTQLPEINLNYTLWLFITPFHFKTWVINIKVSQLQPSDI